MQYPDDGAGLIVEWKLRNNNRWCFLRRTVKLCAFFKQEKINE
tara:strand:+ start:1605 stop:1733 length:129 start_codon:yes stop_codon:yes gene_type:complete